MAQRGARPSISFRRSDRGRASRQDACRSLTSSYSWKFSHRAMKEGGGPSGTVVTDPPLGDTGAPLGGVSGVAASVAGGLPGSPGSTTTRVAGFHAPRRQSSSRAVMLCARRKQKVRESGNSAVARSMLTAIKRRPHVRQMSYKQKQQEPPWPPRPWTKTERGKPQTGLSQVMDGRPASATLAGPRESLGDL